MILVIYCFLYYRRNELKHGGNVNGNVRRLKIRKKLKDCLGMVVGRSWELVDSADPMKVGRKVTGSGGLL